MERIHSRWFGLFLAAAAGLWTAAAQAEEIRYHYVDFDQVEVPPGYTRFGPSALQDSGRVYGGVCDDICTTPNVAYYQNGTVTVFASRGIVTTSNAGGTLGGFVWLDLTNFTYQAALFRGDETELIPPREGEHYGEVLAINDLGTALVESQDADGRATFELYEDGQTIPLAIEPPFRPRGINNEGLVVGIIGSAFSGGRGFRFDPRTGETTRLDPIESDALSWALDINNRGDVLGYSFTPLPIPRGGIERIGVWDSLGVFHPYFTEHTLEHPTVSGDLIFNNKNEIVITLTRDPGSPFHHSYLVPKPGERLLLNDLVENLPEGEDLRIISELNNHGDMIGSSSTGKSFMLERVRGLGRL